MRDKLDQAITAFEDEESDIPFSTRFSNLRRALMWNAFDKLKDIKKNGTKSQISEENTFIQEECMKQFSLIEKMYNSELRAAKLEGKKQTDVDKDWLKKIKETTSTIGEIVRRTDVPSNN